MNTLNQFTNLYPLSKTLRFELIPQGRTLEHITQKGYLDQDEQRAESYQKMKKSIDAFHKHFIELALSNVGLSYLVKYKDLYFAPTETKKDDTYKKDFEGVCSNLRKEIAKAFSNGPAKEIYAKIDKKELITELLENWIITQKDVDLYFDQSFKNFTTYFGGFHENRKNMYSDKPQSTAIGFRLIHENLPKFLDNIKIYETLIQVPELKERIDLLYKECKEYLSVSSIKEVFQLEYFNSVLTQKQIDVYNLIIGGRTTDEGAKKIQGINEYINLYNQGQDKRNKLPKLKKLYKQILSDREHISYLPDMFTDDNEVLLAIEQYYKSNLLSYLGDGKADPENIPEAIQSLLGDLKQYDTDKIYLRSNNLTGISQDLFGNYAVIGDAMDYFFIHNINPGYEEDFQTSNEKKREKLEKVKERFTHQNYFSIKAIQTALDAYLQSLDSDHEFKRFYGADMVVAYFENNFYSREQREDSKKYDLVNHIYARYSSIKGILGSDYPINKQLRNDQIVIENIKSFLDSIMELLHFVKPLFVNVDSSIEKNEVFYSRFEELFEQLNHIIPLYNKVRNYLTQKPYSTRKIKLNFENSTLLNGWDVNKESANTAVLLRKDGYYYLGIMDKKHNKIFEDTPEFKGSDGFEKIVYKLLPGASKMLPKVFFSEKNISYYSPSQQILNIRNHGSHTKGGEPQQGFEKRDFSRKDCHAIIQFFKESINRHQDWKNFGFKFSETESYQSIDEFYREVEGQGYKISYKHIDSKEINQLVDDGKLYLFKIYNKDFSEYSKGKPNLHTLYWKALFDQDNLRNVVYKLNGEAEVFYRKASINSEDIILHKAKRPIINKNPLNVSKSSTFEYDLIKDRRYTIDKFQFHVPITMNFKAIGRDYINEVVNDFLKNNPTVNIIGIDRGERNLIYLTLIDQKGRILKQESMNTIKAENHPIETSYHQLLQQREKERAEARQNWKAIESIKELKEGYVSQVVHQIAKMMVENNAIVVMEDLNFGFKRGRFKVEKQVYQKFEKMLIDKLNYFVLKDRNKEEPGGILNALQLTSKFESFKKLGKQSGFLFYVPAWNTSKIDPTTGFVNLFDTQYENMNKAKEFFEKFKAIQWNANKKYFEFNFDYNDFTTRAEGTQTRWTLCSHGTRILTFRNEAKNHAWDNMEVDLTNEFVELFVKYSIDYHEKSLKNQISSQTDKSFYENLLRLFKLMLQMRNSVVNSDIDYLISPVINKKTGMLYDSRLVDDSLPKDADANGSYHIAKKGLWILKQINQSKAGEKKTNLAISNKDWLVFTQNS